ncbi:MAG TPA: non-canonical purine NTP pyrophosphatase [Phycisphaerales bacterium]|nr:non-canonical purine NTP pyrophosphatase [Phycisphaerales bacterium]
MPAYAHLSTIVLATGNPHKVDELRAIFADAGIKGVRFLGLKDVPAHTVEPHETGSTFADNATIKALSYAQQTGLPALADDSGLEIDALQGRPGVISSHYYNEGHDDGKPREQRDGLNNARILRELEGVPPEQRSARFVCVMALALPNSPIPAALTRGTFEGRIGTPPHVPRGHNGFGYDPLFLVAPDFHLTSAELPKDQKNALSHRAHAAKAMAHEIAQLLRGPHG